MSMFRNSPTVKDFFQKSNRMREIASDLSVVMMQKFEAEHGISSSDSGSASESKGGCPVTGFGAAPELTESDDDHSTSINFDFAKELVQLEHTEAECVPYLMRLLQKGDRIQDVQESVVFLLAAGVDTTRTTLGWLLLALAKKSRGAGET